MKNRLIQSNVAMKSIETIWSLRQITIKNKLKLYKTLVKSVLTYNISTWGLTKKQKEELDRFHRKQLRQIWNDKNKKNKNLYEESNEQPLREVCKQQR